MPLYSPKNKIGLLLKILLGSTPFLLSFFPAMRTEIFIRCHTWLIALCCLLLPWSLHADASHRPLRELGPDEAVSLALAQHEKIFISRSEIDAARGKLWQSYSLALPDLRASYQYTRNLKKPSFFFESGQVPIGFDNVHAFEVRLTQPLTRFGGIYHGILSSRLAYQSASYAHEQTQINLASEVKQTYLQCLWTQSQLVARRLGLDEAEAVQRREKSRLAAGENTPFDRDRASLEVEKRRLELLQSEGNYRVALNGLYRLTGLDRSERLKLTAKLEDFAMPISTAKILENFSGSNAQGMALRKNAESAEQARKASRSDFFPRFYLFSTYQANGQSSERFFPRGQEFSHSIALGVGADIPVFDGMLTLGRYKSAEALAQRTAWEKRNFDRELRLELERNLIEAKTLFAQIEVAQKSLNLAQALYRQAELRFENNLISFIDLKDIQVQLEQARTDYLYRLYEYASAKIRIEQLTGSTLDDE